MARVSAEQVSEAKKIDLFTYLAVNEPRELVPSGTSEYRTATHSSLVISNGKWFWHKMQIGGRSALDFLIKVRGVGFVEAVRIVLGVRDVALGAANTVATSHGGGHGGVELPRPPPPALQEQRKWTFHPPRPVRYSNKAVAYLQRRGINAQVIGRAMEQGILYEGRYFNPDSPYHNIPVCVFAGKNEAGEVAYANLRGIDNDFRLDKAGSDKRHGFALSPTGSASSVGGNHLICFESPIDLLSHASLQQMDARNQGVSHGWGGWDGHRLSLGGTSSLALLVYLERNPNITRVMLCLDNDEAGLDAARRIKAELAGKVPDSIVADGRFKHIRVSINLPRRVKDFNELLQQRIAVEKEYRSAQKARAEANVAMQMM